MKTIKPQRLAFTCRTFETARTQHFVPTVLVFFAFSDAATLIPEIDMWPVVTGELGDELVDEGMPKRRGELLLKANAYPAGGVPAPACIVRAQLGTIDKSLAVAGARYWELASSAPEAFAIMPIDYRHAFGGKGFAANPIGKGLEPISTAHGALRPLPNVEDPKRLMRGPDDRPAPAGFGPYDLTWPQRTQKGGTYDATWLRDQYPGYPSDTDWSIFNCAPFDQQIDGYFVGDESFLLENLHPEKPFLRGKLPGVRARCFVNQRTATGDRLHDVPMRLETVRLFPHLERGLLVFRGTIEVADDEAEDVLHTLIACEDLATPKSVEHYAAVLARRLDPKTGFLHGLNDAELLPHRPGQAAMPLDGRDKKNPVLGDGLIAKNTRLRVANELERLKATISSMGLDPTKHLTPQAAVEPVPAPEGLPAAGMSALADAEKAQAEAIARAKGADDEVRGRCAAAGIDYEKVRAGGAGNQGGPPAFRADAELDRLRRSLDDARGAGLAAPELELLLADRSLRDKLLGVESALRDAYRRFAHFSPPAAPMLPARIHGVRAEVFAALTSGHSLAGLDLTGANLTNLPFRGADLRGTFLECADLTGVDLTGANLTGAVLTRAALAQARLGGARLAGANLGSAQLAGATLDGADLSDAVLAKANLSGAQLRSTVLTGADLSEARVRGADFRGSSARGLTLLRTDLRGASFVEVDFTQSNFLEIELTEVDLTGATLTAVVLLSVRADRSILRGARLENLRVVEGSTFEGADFREATLAGANLRRTKLAGADFTDADLADADFSGCDLQRANLTCVRAHRARFVRANVSRAKLVAADLMDAILSKALLHGADFSHANLFQADLARIRLDTATIFAEANLQRARVNPGAAP